MFPEKFDLIYDSVAMGINVGIVAKYHNIPQSTISNILRRIEPNKNRTDAEKPKRRRPSKLSSVGLIRLEEQFICKNVIAEMLIPVAGQIFSDYRNMILQEDDCVPSRNKYP